MKTSLNGLWIGCYLLLVMMSCTPRTVTKGLANRDRLTTVTPEQFVRLADASDTKLVMRDATLENFQLPENATVPWERLKRLQLVNTSWEQVQLNNRSWQVLEIRNSHLKQVDFSGSRIQKLIIKNSILEHVSFSGSTITTGRIENTTLSETEWRKLTASSLTMNQVGMTNEDEPRAFKTSGLSLTITDSRFQETKLDGIEADRVEIKNSFFSNLSIRNVTANSLIVSRLRSNDILNLEDATIAKIRFQDCQPESMTWINLERLQSQSIEFDACSFRSIILDRLTTDTLTFRNALISEGGVLVPKHIGVLTFTNMELDGAFWNPWDLKNKNIKKIKGSTIQQGETFLLVADNLPASLLPKSAQDSSLSVEQQVEQAVRQFVMLVKQGEWKRVLGSYFPPKQRKGGEKGLNKYLKKYQRFADKIMENFDYYPEPEHIRIDDESVSVEWGEMTFEMVNIQGKWMIKRIY